MTNCKFIGTPIAYDHSALANLNSSFKISSMEEPFIHSFYLLLFLLIRAPR